MFISLCHEGIFFFLGTDFALPCVQTRCWSNILNNVPGVSVCVCLQHASFGSAGGLHLWITFLCVCVGGWVYLSVRMDE